MPINHIESLTACPLCNNGLPTEAKITDRDTFYIRCSSCGSFEITEECMVFTDMEVRLRQRAERLSRAVKKANEEGNEWPMIKTSLL